MKKDMQNLSLKNISLLFHFLAILFGLATFIGIIFSPQEITSNVNLNYLFLFGSLTVSFLILSKIFGRS